MFTSERNINWLCIPLAKSAEQDCCWNVFWFSSRVKIVMAILQQWEYDSELVSLLYKTNDNLKMQNMSI